MTEPGEAEPGEAEPGEAEPGEAEPTTEDRAAAGHAAGSSDGDDAGERYGGALARDLLRTFREDTGRDPETVDELADWMMRRNAETLEPPGQPDPPPG